MFRSQVKEFLKDYQNQIKEVEIKFWKKRLNITMSAVNSFERKTKSPEVHESKIEVNDKFILSSVGDGDDDIQIESINTEVDQSYENIEK